MNLPARFSTGFRQVTIPNPAHLHRRWDPLREERPRVFEGKCSDYDFDRQTENYQALRKVLRANKMDFLHVAAAKYRGDLHTNHRFVATTTKGALLWHKYVGFVAQGGQNHVFVRGLRIKVSVFLRLSALEQQQLLTGDASDVECVLTYHPGIDETGTLWN